MLFYFVFHFLRNYNDVYVMYCLPVGCNNKKYKLQKISLAVLLDRLGSNEGKKIKASIEVMGTYSFVLITMIQSITALLVSS